MQATENRTALAVTIPTKIEACAARVNSRYAINGANIRFRTDAPPMAEVTDGHMLAVVELEGDKADHPDVIAPTDAFKKKVRGKARLSVNGRVRNEHAGADFDPIEGNFPPCRDVTPGKFKPDDNVVVLSLNAKFLARLADAIGSGNGGVTLVFEKDKQHKPIRVLPVEGKAPALGVLMPISSPADKEIKDRWNQARECFYPELRRTK